MQAKNFFVTTILIITLNQAISVLYNQVILNAEDIKVDIIRSTKC